MGTFPGRQGVALRHQQSSLSWWGAGWGHWGGIPRVGCYHPHHCTAGGMQPFRQQDITLAEGCRLGT